MVYEKCMNLNHTNKRKIKVYIEFLVTVML